MAKKRKYAAVAGRGRITPGQRAARRKNIAIARAAKKKGFANNNLRKSRLYIDTSGSGRKKYGKAYSKAYKKVRGSGKAKSTAREAGMRAGLKASRSTGVFRTTAFVKGRAKKKTGAWQGGDRMAAVVKRSYKKYGIKSGESWKLAMQVMSARTNKLVISTK